MGKVLGGGSSINMMGWARGHKSDWEFFASEADDPAWNYESVL
jgi:choline dehydrogenase